MSEHHHPRTVEGSTAQGQIPDFSSDADLRQRWAEFSQARASLTEVMSDDELRAFGINVEILDERA